MPHQVEFEGHVHEFPDDFTDADIAAALGAGAPTEQSTMSTPMVAGGVTAARMAPGIVAGLNTAAKVAGPFMAKAARSRTVPGILAGAIGGAAGSGRMDAADTAKALVGSAALSQLPRAAAMVERSTSPAIIATRNALGRFMTGGKPAGILARGAGTVGKLAGKASTPLTIASLLYDMATMPKGELAARINQSLTATGWDERPLEDRR